MRRYATYNKGRKLLRRVFAKSPRDALELSKMIFGPGPQPESEKVWYAVEDPMAEVTRGD